MIYETNQNSLIVRLYFLVKKRNFKNASKDLYCHLKKMYLHRNQLRKPYQKVGLGHASGLIATLLKCYPFWEIF